HVLNVRVVFPPGMAMGVAPEDGSLAEQARARAREQILSELTTRLEAIPGVQAAGFVDDMFIAPRGNKSITIPGRAGDSIAAGQLNDGSMTPGFFRAMSVPLRRGRYLARDDAFAQIPAPHSVA